MVLEPEEFVFREIKKDPNVIESIEAKTMKKFKKNPKEITPINSTASLSTNASLNCVQSNSFIEETMSNSNAKDEFLFNYSFNPEGDTSQYCRDYINEIYLNLLEEERFQVFKPSLENISRQAQINFKMRKILFDWLIEIHSQLPYKNRTLYLALYLIDSFLSYAFVSKANYQLVGISAFLISCKSEEIDVPSIDKLIYLTDNAYSKEQVINMENQILKALNFNITVPLFFDFYEILTKISKFSESQYYLGLFFYECFLLNEQSINCKQSTLALTLVYIVNKFHKMDKYEICYDSRLSSEREPKKVIKELAKTICNYIDNDYFNESNKSEASKIKYSTEKYQYVAFYNLK